MLPVTPLPTAPTGSAEAPAVPVRCSQLSVLDEPLPGTATTVDGWVCMEHPSPWGRDILDGTAFGTELTSRLKDRLDAAGVRLMLIRQPGRATISDGDRALYLAQSHPEHTRCVEMTVDSPWDLLDIDLSVAAPGPRAGAPDPPPVGRTITDPVTLVCAHGRRDRCCALDGRPLAAALAADGDGDIWECSHTGGHRFAPSMIVLPTGYSYGRVTIDEARAAVDAIRAGKLSPDGLRGRTCWDSESQVAEMAVRERLTDDGEAPALNALTVSALGQRQDPGQSKTPGQGERLVSHADGRQWRVTTRSETLAPRAASCGAAPKPVATAQVTDVARV